MSWRTIAREKRANRERALTWSEAQAKSERVELLIGALMTVGVLAVFIAWVAP